MLTSWKGLVLIQVALCWSLYSLRLAPASHDAFQIFQLQYYFLNHSAIYGELPYWMPFMTQGTISDWWFLIQGNLFTLALSAFPGILRQLSFLAVFHIGLFFELLVLTLGFWFWMRRFVSHSGAVFAGALILLVTSLWFIQPWYNLRLFAYLPLIFHFLHRWQDSRRMVFLCFAMVLAAAQALGSLPYFLPVASFVVFSYFLALTHFSRDGWRQLVRDWHALLAASALGLVLFAPYYVILSMNRDWLENYNMGRSVSGSVSLQEFLGYGVSSPQRWLEWWISIPFQADVVISAGAVLSGAVFLSIYSSSKIAKKILASLAGLVLLLSLGGPIAAVAFYVWPLMSYFRHLSLLAPFVKLFLLALAVLGMDAWWSGKVPRRGFIPPMVMAVFTVAFTSWTLFHPGAFLEWVKESCKPLLVDHGQLPFNPALLDETLMRWWLFSSAFFAAAGLIYYVSAFRFKASNLKTPGLLLIGVQSLFLVVLQAIPQLRQLSPEAEQAIAYQAMPYAERRSLEYYNNPRARALDSWLRSPGSNFYSTNIGELALYWSTESLLFQDSPFSPFRSDHWGKPLDEMAREALREPLNPAHRPSFALPLRLVFPIEVPKLAKESGLTANKARLLRSDGSEHSIKPQVTFFSANRIEMTWPAPLLEKDITLAYSDVFHTRWRARVDGQETTLFKRLAYKSVMLPKGAQRVEIYFDPGILGILEPAYCYFAVVVFLLLSFLGVKAAARLYRSRKINLSGSIPVTPQSA